MEQVRLLWTGGWDSTFRLLHLMLVEMRVVQPYYVIDCDRVSFGHEIRAMEHIKALVAARWPEARSRILPTVFRSKADIAPHAGIAVIHLTKLDLLRQARRQGFADILEETWFCFRPRRGRPCGRCNPCAYAIQHGLARRIPPLRRIRYYLVRRPLRALRKNETLRRIARKILHRERPPAIHASRPP